MYTRNKYVVGPPYSRTEIYAARVSHAADDAHRPPLHGFVAAARTDDADGQTDTVTFKYAYAYAVRVNRENVTIRYDTRCYLNVRSKANVSQRNLPHGTDN